MFHTLEQKVVERDLRATRSKLCESTFLQECVAAFERYLASQLACQKLAHELYTDPQVQAKYPNGVDYMFKLDGSGSTRHPYKCVLE